MLTALAHAEAASDEPDGASAQAHRAQAAFEVTRESVSKANPAKITIHTVHASNAPGSICDYAIEHGFDLLVIGRHGDGGLLHNKLGHVAEAAAKTSKIPVLLVSAS